MPNIDNTKIGTSNYFDLKNNDPIVNSNIPFTKNYTVETPKIQPIVKQTNPSSIFISDDPKLKDITTQAMFFSDLKNKIPGSDMVVKYSKNIYPYREEFRQLYDNNEWFKTSVDNMMNSGNLTGVESMFSNTMSMKQTTLQKYGASRANM